MRSPDPREPIRRGSVPRVWAARLAALVLLLADPASSQDPPPDDPASGADDAPLQQPAPPGPRVRVGGLQGVTLKTRVVFDSAPDWPQLSEWTFAFPARARWRMEPEGGGSGQRRLRYRFGEGCYVLESGSAQSTLREGAARLADVRLFELRAALLLWPAGADWKSEEGRHPAATLGAAGKLTAELDGEGRPAALVSVTPKGEVVERLVVAGWSRSEKPGERTWPTRLELHIGAKRIWTEEVLAVETDRRFRDDYFLPPDRRPKRARSEVVDVREERFPSDLVLRESLPEGSDLDAARSHVLASRAALESLLEKAGGKLDPHPALELDADLLPLALRWRAATLPTTAPEGWVRKPAFEALMRPLAPEVHELTRELLGPLRSRAAERGLVTGPPHLRWRIEAEGPPRALELLLPVVQ